MSFDAALALAVVAVAVLLIAREVVSPDVALMAALVVLMGAGVAEPREALAAFANPALATVAGLFVVAAGLKATGVLGGAARAVFGRTSGLRGALGRMTSATAALSAFVSNTPIVAMGVPAVSAWAERKRLSPSRFLIPLSYASILGGICTLIGTSTNLVSDGLLGEHGMAGLGFFELAVVGVPCAIVGVIYLSLAAPFLLSDRVPIRTVGEHVRRYLVEMRLSDPSPLIGKTIEEAGLRHLPGLFLVRVERPSGIISPVGPEVRLVAGDRLTFAGVVDTIVDLRKYPGLTPITPEGATRPGDWELHEAVVSSGSPLAGTNIRDANFRGRYNAAVIAVHRHGEHIRARIGDIVLRPGDTLLIEAASGFARAYRDSSDFYLVSRVGDSAAPRYDRSARAVGILLAMVVVAALDILPVVVASLGAGMLMVGLGCIKIGEAKRSIDWSVLLTIGSALGIATALESSGAAGILAAGIAGSGAALGTMGVLAAIFVGTMVLTELVSNTAAAAIMFPVALSTSAGLGLTARPFIVAITVAASLSLSTPIGYQTNLIVYGPGGYKFTDFTRVGLPLQLLLALLCVLLIPLFWPFLPS